MAKRQNGSCDDCNSQSLMNVLNKFVDAVNVMDDKVMVPSRLRDMELSEMSTSAQSEENNNLAVLPVASSSGEDLYSYYEMINAVKSELVNGKGLKHTHLPAITNSAAGTGLIGESDGESDTLSDDCSSVDSASDAAGKTAEVFRHHLQGLFGLLHQLTDTAKFLGDAYEQQVGGRKMKKFVI